VDERARLLHWYRKHARDLPWRKTQDPWAILVSEVLLQQTRVEQALPYYRRVLARFPTAKSLAQAPLSELLSLWQGAGYYRRAEHLHRSARIIAARGFPRDFEGLRALPGVGPYTAGAVASIAFGERVPAVDGNVRRVLARVFALEAPTEAELWRRAAAWMPKADPGSWNQALMELGARVCTPRAPRCAECPLKARCQGRGAPERYPRPLRQKSRSWRLFALVAKAPGGYLLARREESPWAGLYGPPLGEDPKALLRAHGLEKAQLLGELRYALSHRKIRAQVLYAELPSGGTPPETVPLSAFARRVFEFAEQALAEAEPGEAFLAVALPAAGAGAGGVEPG